MDVCMRVWYGMSLCVVCVNVSVCICECVLCKHMSMCVHLCVCLCVFFSVSTLHFFFTNCFI